MAANKTSFQKGQKVPGAGRPKGTPNKRTLDLKEKLDQLGVDPAEALATILKEQMAIFEMRKAREQYQWAAEVLNQAEKTAADLMQYLYPKRKAVEHSGDLNLKSWADFMAAATGTPLAQDPKKENAE